MADNVEPAEIGERAARELQLARDADDETRLGVLDDLLRRLESELERDGGEAGAPRR